MSTLKELLNKHCPNGVEYKQIKDIAKINRGIIISKKYIEENKGDYPVYSSQTENNGELGRINNYAYDGEYLTWTTDGANAGSVFYRNEKFNITNVCGLIKITESNVITKFVYYILRIYAPKYVNRGMGNCKLMSNVMESIKIPLPPIEVQKEIVRILDEFTDKTTKLQELLHRETILRKKQYEYYRDKLLTFDDDIELKKLGEIANISRGGKLQKKDFVNNGFPCIHYGQIHTKYSLFPTKTFSFIPYEIADKEKKASKNDIIMAVTSENVDDVCKCIAWLGNTDVAVGGHTAIISHNQNPKYLAYYFNTSMFFYQKIKIIQGTKVMEVSPNKLKNILVPVPPLEEQERIVNILDKFDALCNDITKGLPAEIEMRKKQYEYYRDKLLTFKEKKK